MSRVEPDDEVLPAGPGVPRWVPVLAAIVLVVVGFVAVAAKLRSATPPGPSALSATASSSHRPDSAPATSQPVPAPIATGPALSLPTPSEPLDIAVVGDEAWLLQTDRLSTFTTDADYRTRELAGVNVGANGAQPRVLVDSSAHRVWVVTLGVTGSRIRAFDASTLVPQYDQLEAASVFSAAPLDGGLVITTASGVYRLRPGERPARVPGADGDGELTPDPSRSRVLLLRAATHAIVETIGASGPAHTVVLQQSVASGTLAVTGSGAIWLGGYGDIGAVLIRLDPVTFGTVARSPTSFEAGSGLEIVAGGTDDILVQTGEVPTELACIAGTNGASLQTWPLLTDTVALTQSTGYAVIAGGLVPLELHGLCTG